VTEPSESQPDPRRFRGQPFRVPLESATTPEMIIAGLDPGDHPAVLWGHWFGGGVLVMVEPMITISVDDASAAFAYLDRQPEVGAGFDGIGGGWLACLGYSPGHASLAFYDALLRWTPADGWSFESLGLVGREAATREALRGWSAALASTAPAPVVSVGPFGPRQPVESARDQHLAAVEDAIGRIHRGDFYQMNLCTRLHAELDGSPTALFAALAGRLQPSYGALVTAGSGAGLGTVASFSPELFLRVHDRTATTRPIKGTAPRHGAETDSSALRASSKDAAENIMIVDLMRNDLSRVCEPGTVTVSDLLAVQPHPGVWHLVSTVKGRLRPDVTVEGLLEATFPPGSVTGAPKLAAQRGIRELETQSRGTYTGSIGMVSPCAGSELSVVIRSFEIDGRNLALGVGGGLTADSVPVLEWDECLHKAAPLVAAAGSTLVPGLTGRSRVDPGLAAAGVFESVLIEHGRLVRLDRHLARLDTSCRELYGRGLASELAETVRRELRADPSNDPRRVLRITVRPGAHGDVDTSTELRTLGPRLWTCTLSRQDRPEQVWRHKWCDRRALDAAERAAAPDLPYFTDRPGSDRLSETSRGNLFLLGPDEVWRTPPLDGSLLPGVTRREVLDRFAERQIPFRVQRCAVDDLAEAEAVFWTSSLSGIVAVSAVDGRALDSIGAVATLLDPEDPPPAH